MEETKYTIREMKIEDFEEVHNLWMTIKGFGIRTIDDSKEGVEIFIKRNPTTSIVAEADGKIVGSILCGHDGRRGCFYHVCVAEAYRKHGIGKSMAVSAMHALQKEKIDIALKVQKQIEEFFVFLQDGRESAFLSLIESSDAFQR